MAEPVAGSGDLVGQIDELLVIGGSINAHRFPQVVFPQTTSVLRLRVLPRSLAVGHHQGDASRRGLLADSGFELRALVHHQNIGGTKEAQPSRKKRRPAMLGSVSGVALVSWQPHGHYLLEMRAPAKCVEPWFRTPPFILGEDGEMVSRPTT